MLDGQARIHYQPAFRLLSRQQPKAGMDALVELPALLPDAIPPCSSGLAPQADIDWKLQEDRQIWSQPSGGQLVGGSYGR